MLETARTWSRRSVFPRSWSSRSSSYETSKWSSIAFLPRPVTMMMLVRPAAIASSITYWMIGLSTSGSISLGWALVAGRKRVPSPAAGNTALRMTLLKGCPPSVEGEIVLQNRPYQGISPFTVYDQRMLDAAFVRDHLDDVRTGLRNRGLQPDAELEQVATLEARRRRLIPELEGLKRDQN